MPRPAVMTSQVSDTSILGVDYGTRKPRPNSSYLRELTFGKFLIKCEEITMLENIGQGNGTPSHKYITVHVYVSILICVYI